MLLSVDYFLSMAETSLLMISFPFSVLSQENITLHDPLKEEMMLCWGYWAFGHPGAGSNSQAVIAEPRSSGFIHERSVKEVACGGNHSIFLLEDGEVFTCGLNAKGQLGHDGEGNKPGILILNTCTPLLLLARSTKTPKWICPQIILACKNL